VRAESGQGATRTGTDSRCASAQSRLSQERWSARSLSSVRVLSLRRSLICPCAAGEARPYRACTSVGSSSAERSQFFHVISLVSSPARPHWRGDTGRRGRQGKNGLAAYFKRLAWHHPQVMVNLSGKLLPCADEDSEVEPKRPDRGGAGSAFSGTRSEETLAREDPDCDQR
jgi:hypothetical protein